MDVDAKYRQIRNLGKYKAMNDEAVMEAAKRMVSEKKIKVRSKDEDLDIDVMFIDKDEKKLAKALLGKYLSDYSIETISDKNTLKQLIYLEIMNVRMQKILNDTQETSNTMSMQMVDGIHKNINEIIILKDKLGISQQGQTDSYKSIEILKKKFSVWRKENSGSRNAVCPFCGKMILFKARMENWEAQKHPFFKDRIITNDHLIKMYKDGTITKTDVSKVLEVSEDYIDWVITKLHSKPELIKQIKNSQSAEIPEKISEVVDSVMESIEKVSEVEEKKSEIPEGKDSNDSTSNS